MWRFEPASARASKDSQAFACTGTIGASGTFAACCAVNDHGPAVAQILSYVPNADENQATFKATNTYTVVLRNWDAKTAGKVGAQLEATLLNMKSGHNGIWVECSMRVPGDTERLTAFPTESAGNYFCMTFRREKPFGT